MNVNKKRGKAIDLIFIVTMSLVTVIVVGFLLSPRPAETPTPDATMAHLGTAIRQTQTQQAAMPTMSPAETPTPDPPKLETITYPGSLVQFSQDRVMFIDEGGKLVAFFPVDCHWTADPTTVTTIINASDQEVEIVLFKENGRGAVVRVLEAGKELCGK